MVENESSLKTKKYWPAIALGTMVLMGTRGLGRAVWIACRSRFAFKPKHESLRLKEVRKLRNRLTDKDFSGMYSVVSGPTGIGKTCLVNTVTRKTPGVIQVDARSAKSSDTIIDDVLRKLTGIPYRFYDPSDSAKCVVFWHRISTFGRPPVVVIKATDRSVGKRPNGIEGVARTLMDQFNLRVIVHGSPNIIDIYSHRQSVVELEPMTKAMIWQMEQLQELFKYINEAGLDDIVFSVLGGVPVNYTHMWWNISPLGLQQGKGAREVIGNHLRKVMFNAHRFVRDSKGDMAEIIKLFDKERMYIRCDTLAANNLKRPVPDTVFWETKRDGESVLVPASNAIGIILRHGLKGAPSLDELEKLVQK